MLVAEGLVKRYRGRAVLDGASFAVGPGEIVGLVGPNGAGKTTAFSILIGVVRPDAGEVRLGEVELTGRPIFERARLGLGYLAQEASIFRRLSVEDNLLAVLELRGAESRLDSLLDAFELGPLRRRLGESLSGGERRKVEIARAMAAEPKVLLLDEPFAGLDPIAIGELRAQLRRLAEGGLGLFVTDHNARETLSLSSRAYLLVGGRVVAEGPRLADDPIAKAAYLGPDF